jgi:intracellular sulfur oxidation DsrE/DsrF family protein
MLHNDKRHPSRRTFLGVLAGSTAAMSMASVAAPLSAGAKTISEHMDTGPDDPEAWMKQIKGKHRVVFDVTRPNEMLPFAWPRIFLVTNEQTGTPEKDNSVVVVLRHDGIPYALKDELWAKYKLGEFFKADDMTTHAPAVRNPFWQPKDGDYKVPGVGNVAIGINELQKSGVQFLACNMALTVYSAVMAEKMNMKHEDVKKDWMAGLLPGVQVVPSGVWALGRAQERGCGYVFAG